MVVGGERGKRVFALARVGVFKRRILGMENPMEALLARLNRWEEGKGRLRGVEDR